RRVDVHPIGLEGRRRHGSQRTHVARAHGAGGIGADIVAHDGVPGGVQAGQLDAGLCVRRDYVLGAARSTDQVVPGILDIDADAIAGRIAVAVDTDQVALDEVAGRG